MRNDDGNDGTCGQVGHLGERPHDDDLGWDLQRWDQIEEDVRRLRRRIFKASQEGDLKRVRSLQKLMLRSQANTLHVFGG